MDPIFLQAIEQTFPKLEREKQLEIYKKVSSHMLEKLQEEVYRDDPSGLEELKDSQNYPEIILEKLASLSPDKQAEINKKIASELTRVMHELYKAYE